MQNKSQSSQKVGGGGRAAVFPSASVLSISSAACSASASFKAVGTVLGGTEGDGTVSSSLPLALLCAQPALHQTHEGHTRENRTAHCTIHDDRASSSPPPASQSAQPPQHPYPKAHSPDSKTARHTAHNQIHRCRCARDQRRGIGVGRVVGAAFEIAEGCGAPSAVTGLGLWSGTATG